MRGERYIGSHNEPLFQSKPPPEPEEITAEDLEIIQAPPAPSPESLPSSPPPPGE